MQDYHQLMANTVTAHALKLGRAIDYIEVGVFRGDSALAIMSTGHCRYALLIDDFSNTHCGDATSSLQTAEANLHDYGGLFEIDARPSHTVLPTVKRQFDVGFVDGEHTIDGCYGDIVLMWPLIREDGVMFIDDMRHAAYPHIEHIVEQFARDKGLKYTYHEVHEGLGGIAPMINPNQLGRKPFPASASQWMLVGLRGGAPPAIHLVDGDPVTTWVDSSGNGHTAAQTGTARPTFKTNIINGKPVVRFTTAGLSGLNLTTSITGAGGFTSFMVSKLVAAGGDMFSLASSTGNGPTGIGPASGATFVVDRTGYRFSALDYNGAFHVLTGWIDGLGNGSVVADGTIAIMGGAAAPSTGDLECLGYRSFAPGTYSDGDMAEVVHYSAVLSVTDRANVEKYLGTKYGITVAGGSVVDPLTVAGLAGWWKADSLL